MQRANPGAGANGAGRIAVAAAVGLMAILPGCSAIKTYALDMTGGVLLEGSVAVNTEPDFEIVRQSFPATLKTVEVINAANPGNLDVLYMLGQGFDAYTYLVLEDELDLADAAGDTAKVKELKSRASALYRRGQTYASKLVRGKNLTSAEVLKVLENGTPQQMKDMLARLDKSVVPGLFWYTFGWVGQINLDQSNPARIAELPRIEAMINRIVELDPTYFHGLPLIISGSVYASRGTMFGGDLPRGNAFFEKGVKASDGKFLLAKFTWARYYALQAQDKALFCRLMTEVVEAPTDLLPEQQMMNNVSQRWASRWRARASSLFEDGQPCPTSGAGTKGDAKEDDDGLL